MLGNGDRALDLGTVCRGLGLPHAPVLIKGGISVNGGLIHSRGLVNVIGAPICIHRTQCRGCPRRSPTAPGFYDVVFNQGIPGPAVHAHVGVSVGLIIHTVFDGDIAQLIVGLGAVILLALAEQTVVDVAPLAAKGAPSGQGHAGVAVVLPQLIGIAVLGTGLVFGNDRGCGSGRQRCKGQAHRRRQQTVKKSADGVFSHVDKFPAFVCYFLRSPSLCLRQTDPLLMCPTVFPSLSIFYCICTKFSSRLLRRNFSPGHFLLLKCSQLPDMQKGAPRRERPCRDQADKPSSVVCDNLSRRSVAGTLKPPLHAFPPSRC